MQGDPIPDVIARYIAAYNTMDVDGMLSCLADDVRFENITHGRSNVVTENKAALDKIARASLDAFSERTQTPTNCIAVGDRACVAVAFRAVIASDLPNGLKAGHVIEAAGASFFELRDGLIASILDVA